MATNNIKKTGTSNAFKSDAGNATLIREPVIGVVKNNIDPTHSGKIDVYIGVLGGADPDDSNNWIKGIRYLSPFYGVTSPEGNPKDGPDKSGNGAFVGNPQSYGFWASAPDIGTEVLCVFVNGRQNQGYYIGCVPKSGLLQMTPAMGASDNVVPNAGEGDSYGGADRLPTSEINVANPSLAKSVQQHAEAKPVHSYQSGIFNSQGLIRDGVRGPISSSAQRETPSRVFGLSTPGGPIFEGGFTSQTIRSAAKTVDPAKLKQVGRTGGHSIVMDDGTFDGADQLMRLRTSGGHQIMMNDSGQALFIIHANGQSWIELGKEGTIDMYSTNSFNVRTQGDINMHADRNININASKNLNLYGENVKIESSKATTHRVGTNFSGYTMGSFTVKVDGSMSQSASGQASYVGGAETFINGSKVNLNSGSASLTPMSVPVIDKTNHQDSMCSPTAGWISQSTEPLVSITNRAPAHQPWIGSGVGVDVQVSSSPSPASQQTTPAATAINATTPSTPSTPTSPAAVAAVPNQVAATGPMTSEVIQASAAQIATNAQSQVTAGVTPSNLISPVSGLTTGMAELARALPPGAAAMVEAKVAAGMPMAKALSSIGAGATGLNPATLFSSVGKQAEVVAAAVSSSTQRLMASGLLTGNESPAQAAGLALATTTQGLDAIKTAVSTGVVGVAISNDIASGKFAGGLADSAIGGLKTSLTGMIDGAKGKVTALGDSIADLKDNLKSGLQNAFSAVEKSFGKLKAGVPNKLGPPSGATEEQSATSKAAGAYESAQASVTSATDAFFAAKRDYRNDPTPEMQAKVQAAEAALSAARQQVAQAGTAFLKSPTATMGIDTVKNSLNSGLNSLPGGPAILQTVIKNTGAGATIATASSAVAMVNKAMSLADGAQTGDIMGQAKETIDSMVGKVTGNMGDLKAGAAGMMAQLEASMGSIAGGAGALKTAVAATGTFDKSSIVAKTGQLLGDARIPSPIPPDSPPSVKPEQLSAEVSASIKAVADATAEVKRATLVVAESMKLMTNSATNNDQYLKQLQQSNADLEIAEQKLATANAAYAKAINV